LQSLQERGHLSLRVQLVRRGVHQHADAPHPFLRARGKRPSRHSTQRSKKFPPPHIRPLA
jgi:hypothetical protein